MTTTTRPLILDLLPSTPRKVIHTVTCWDRRNPRYYLAAWLSADGVWHASNGDGHVAVLDPADITEFTIHTGGDTTTYTEGADTNEWTAIIRRRQP